MQASDPQGPRLDTLRPTFLLENLDFDILRCTFCIQVMGIVLFFLRQHLRRLNRTAHTSDAFANKLILFGWISHEVVTNDAGCFTVTAPVRTLLMLEWKWCITVANPDNSQALKNSAFSLADVPVLRICSSVFDVQEIKMWNSPGEFDVLLQEMTDVLFLWAPDVFKGAGTSLFVCYQFNLTLLEQFYRHKCDKNHAWPLVFLFTLAWVSSVFWISYKLLSSHLTCQNSLCLN